MDLHDLIAIRNRRRFLQQTACGLGTVALSQLLAGETTALPATNPLAPRPPHFKPRAQNVIFIFMSGAPSQYDLFLPCPEMKRLHRQPVPESFLHDLDDALIKGSAQVFASPRKFTKHGDCGMDFSDYLPDLATCADELCMVRSMHTDVSNHHPAQLLMNCGVPLFGMPSMGSWVTYGLGSEASDLPGFVVLLSNSGEGVDGGSSLWNNGFLPSEYGGVNFRSKGDPILHLTSPKGVSLRTQRSRVDVIRQLNELRRQETGGTASTTRRPSGLVQTVCWLDAWSRVVFALCSFYHSTWDDHSNLNEKLKTNCDMTQLPTAGLIKDLKQRGLLDDTLVIWGGEFGPTPMNEVRRGNTPGKEGRDHHPFAFTMLLAGGGVKGGQLVGKTDELGYHPTEDPIHVHDLQATILHCLGLDHEALTFRHQGRDFRLTDVGGSVVHKLLV